MRGISRERRGLHAALLAAGALLIIACILLVSSRAAAASEPPVIIQQPESVLINYPDGCEFHVEVSKPGKIKSYQWMMTDGYSVFVLDGKTATTDTLVIPSTQQDDPLLTFWCEMKDNKGNTLTSEEATMDILNRDEDITVLYVGDRAVTAGEELDLSGTGLGSGKVIFDSDGANITMKNVSVSTKNYLYDTALSPSLGLYLVRRNPDQLSYNFHLDGDCKFVNTFFDSDYNSGGVVLNAFFATGDQNNHPTLVFDGTGKLILQGGSHYIYTDANVEFNTDLATKPNGKIFTDGITCFSLYLDEGVTAKLKVHGTGVHTNGDLHLYEGSVLKIDSEPVSVSVGPTVKDMAFIMGSVYANGATIDITGNARSSNFVKEDKYLAMLCGMSLNGYGAINCDNSTINITIRANRSRKDFAANLTGIAGSENNNALDLMNKSTVNIKIDAPKSFGSTGITLGGIVNVEPESSLTLDIKGSGETFGMEVGRDLIVDDGDIRSKVVSTSKEMSYGIVCGTLNINLTDRHHQVCSVAKTGIALAADTGERSEEAIGYVAGYEPSSITLSGEARIMTPRKGSISVFGVPGYGMIIRAETFFARRNTLEYAHQVRIAVKGYNRLMWILCAAGGVVVAAAVAAGVLIALRKRRVPAR